MAAKIITDFSNFTEPDFYKASMRVYKTLKINAAFFTDLPVKMNILLPLIVKFDNARTNLVYHGKGADVKDARKKVEKILRKNGNWLNIFADGDETLLNKTGYPFQGGFKAQGQLEETVLEIRALKQKGRVSYSISKIQLQGIRYGIMYTLTTNEDNNPAHWNFHYCAGRKGIISELISKEKHKFVSFGMGSEGKLTYSNPIEMSPQ